jgi:hypothetical protein
MKYSGSDFKFTSQANHLQKLLALKTENHRENIHAQRLYKRRMQGHDGRIMSNWSILNQSAIPGQQNAIPQSESNFSKDNPSTIIYVDNRENDDMVVSEWEPIGDKENDVP